MKAKEALKILLIIILVVSISVQAYTALLAQSEPGQITKLFGYNALSPEQLGSDMFLPFLAKNFRGWNSTLVIANTITQPITLQIDIWNKDGVFVKGLTNIAVNGQGVYSFELAQSDFADNLYQAHVVATAATGITPKIGVEVHSESEYMAVSYAGIGSPYTQLLVPVIEKKVNDWNTSLYVHNTAPTSARMRIDYYSESGGQPILTKQDLILPPFQSFTQDTFAELALPDNFLGYAIITANRAVSAVVLRQNYVQESAMIYPAYAVDWGTQAPRLFDNDRRLADYRIGAGFLVVPWVTKEASGWGTSLLRVQALRPVETQVVYSFYNLDGTQAGEKFDVLWAKAVLRYRLDEFDSLPPGFAGSLIISSSQPLVTSIAQEIEAGGDQYGYPALETASTIAYLPFVAEPLTPDPWQTRLLVQNVGPSSSSITLFLYTQAGTPYTTTPSVLSPGSSQLLDLSQLVGTIPDGFTGQAIVTAPQPLSALVIGNIARPALPHMRVVTEGLPRTNALVLQNGALQGLTDAEGIMRTAPNSTTVVLDPIQTGTTARGAHNGWAYHIYTSNLAVNQDGSVTIADRVRPQIFTTIKTNSLILFNILVSVEWDADATYLTMLEDALRKASDYLYDVTDGQMAFGEVHVYDNGQYWTDADFQISTKNTVRPYAYIGGIGAAEDSAHAIRVGRFWDGGSGNQGNWNEPEGYRTLIHEFGHYALYLEDEYFVRKLDAEGRFIGRQNAACTSQDIFTGVEQPANASIMYYQYKASELADSDRWNVNCQNTEQHRVNGQSDWATVLEQYGGTEWVLHTPTTRGSVMAGPETFPRHLLPFPTTTMHNGGIIKDTTASRSVTVVGPEGQPVANALVALFTTPPNSQQAIAIDQGLTNQDGQIAVFGAAKGDRLQAATIDSVLAGAVTVDADLALTLPLARIGGVNAASSGALPHLSLLPTSDGAGLLIQVNDVAQSPLPLTAFVLPAASGGAPQSTILTYNPATAGYGATVSLDGVGLGTGRLQVGGANLPVTLYSDYNLQRIIYNNANSLYAEDGNFALHLPPAAWSGGADGYATILPTGYIPGAPPTGKRIIGSSYDVRLSIANLLTKAAIVELYYHPEVIGNKLTKTIYLWEPVKKAWTPLQSETDPNNQTVSAITTHLGIYALMEEAITGTTKLYLPLIKQ